MAKGEKTGLKIVAVTEPDGESGGLPHLRTLLSVIPIAQVIAHADTSLTVLSLEVYDEGFLIPTWLRTIVPANVFPEVVFHATDDRGGSYRAWPGGGYRSGPGTDGAWRRDYVFAPTLDPAASTLYLTVQRVALLRPGPWVRTVETAQIDVLDQTLAVHIPRSEAALTSPRHRRQTA